MQEYKNKNIEEEEEEETNDEANNLDSESEDALSFRDIPIVPDDEDEPNNELDNEEFEFKELETQPKPETLALFKFGEAVPVESPKEFTRHPKNGLFIRKDSFKRSHSFRSSPAPITVASPESPRLIPRSNSVRFSPCNVGQKPACSHSTPGRHKAVFGLVRVQSKMEMSDIRKRQSRRRSPPIMFPASISGDDTAVVEKRCGGSGYWSLFKPRRSSVNLVGSLTKSSFGCIPHV